MEADRVHQNIKVSVIIAFKDKPSNLCRCLQSWSQITYPNVEYLLIDDGSRGSYADLINGFSLELPNLQYFRLENGHDRTPAVAFNFGFEQSEGDFIIFTDEDLIFGCPDLIQRMLAFYSGYRINLKTYFLNEDCTQLLDKLDWLHCPNDIEKLVGFWDYYRYDAETTNRFLHDHWQNYRVTFLTGQYRKDWEWIGLFRDDKSHLTRDQDLVLREACVNKVAQTLPEIACYHQYHAFPDVYVAPGYRYLSERQARLLEPAPPE